MKYNDEDNEVMDGWPTFVMWILLIIGIILCF
jgi:hypothetical protein